VANPKGDIPGNLGFEGKGAKVKGSKAKSSFPFTDYCQMDSQKKKSPTGRHLFARQNKKELERAAVVSTSQFNDYL
jgi:hypothetical protein